MMREAIVLTTLGMAVAGCATNVTQSAALLLVDQIDAYEESLNAKLAAEQRFYAQTRRDLEDSARRQARREQQLEYLVGVTELSDQATVRDRGLQLSALQAFLRNLNETGREEEETRSQREAELRALYRVNFELLTTERQQLGRTRSQLLDLAREKSTKDELERFLGESTRRAIEMNEQADTSEESN